MIVVSKDSWPIVLVVRGHKGSTGSNLWQHLAGRSPKDRDNLGTFWDIHIMIGCKKYRSLRRNVYNITERETLKGNLGSDFRRSRNLGLKYITQTKAALLGTSYLQHLQVRRWRHNQRLLYLGPRLTSISSEGRYYSTTAVTSAEKKWR